MAEWVELTEGCRMPTNDEIVLLSVVGPDDTWVESAKFSLKGEFNRWAGRRETSVDFDGPLFIASDGTVHYGEKWADRDWDGEAGYLTLTAWMPAPKPFVKGQA